MRTHGTAFDIRGLASTGVTFSGTTLDDHFHGGAGDDTFNMEQGGEDTVSGSGGSDTFNFGTALDGGDRISGGKGDDTLSLTASDDLYAFDSDTISSVEQIRLQAGGDYDLQFEATAVSEQVTIVGEFLGAGERLVVSCSPLTARSFYILGGAADDNLSGGQQHDIFYGESGADAMNGGGGSDVYGYGYFPDSTGINFDTVAFDVNQDRFSFFDEVNSVDEPVHGGKLNGQNDVHFNASLEGRIGAAELAAHHAVVFAPKHGQWGGATFLIVDDNGVAGYQGGEDFVIRMTGDHLDHLNVGNIL